MQKNHKMWWFVFGIVVLTLGFVCALLSESIEKHSVKIDYTQQDRIIECMLHRADGLPVKYSHKNGNSYYVINNNAQFTEFLNVDSWLPCENPAKDELELPYIVIHIAEDYEIAITEAGNSYVKNLYSEDFEKEYCTAIEMNKLLDYIQNNAEVSDSRIASFMY